MSSSGWLRIHRAARSSTDNGFIRAVYLVNSRSMKDAIIGGGRVKLAGGTDREGGGEGPLVVLLHGFGAPGDDLVPLFRQLDVPRSVRFAFPEAPIDLGELVGPAYAGGRAWWMIDPAWFDPKNQGKLA